MNSRKGGKLKDGEITAEEYKSIAERWEKKIGREPINWVWFPTFRGFTELLETFREEKEALLIYTSSTKNLDSLREGTDFEIYRKIHSKSRHVAILGKPSWAQDKRA
jgi:hypothetical protein